LKGLITLTLTLRYPGI